ncbi:integrase [Vibrio parahaemolyticus]|uniref:integrase n=1 Tax=Vibrio parahaemolyticus TaxID=670 RepID=UPI000BE23778|nr:integrase [Vibrio parahaemolyticus]ATI47250.1 integrase [Vibrio parahaemolyticus]MBE5181208.1 site-specific integrase [Vibrio parahaemolyticus]
MQLPTELSFLDEIFVEDNSKFQTAKWLESDFVDNVWRYNFEFKTGSKTLDWNVTLYDGSQLTDAKNSTLLKSLKHWLVASTDRTINSKSQSSNTEPSIAVQNRNFRTVLRLIDFFLLNAENYKLAEYSLGAVTEDDLKHILNCAYSNKVAAEGLFDWSCRASQFFKSLINTTDQAKIDSVLQKHPELTVVNEDVLAECPLNLSEDEVILVRAALVIHDLMRDRRARKTKKGIPEKGEYGLNTKKLSQIIYKRCLYISNEAKPNFEVFDIIVNAVNFRREMPSVNVRTKEDDLLSHSNYIEFQRAIHKLTCLNIINLPSPSVSEIYTASMHEPEIKSKQGRFTTIPYNIVFKAIEDAITFHLKYGDKLIESYCNLVTLATQKGVKIPSLTNDDFLSALEPEIKELGVSRYGLTCKVAGDEAMVIRKSESSEFYAQLRSNKGFLELIQIYYGATKIVTGALVARRDGELSDLIAGSCLDDTEEWLIFKLRKSTKNLNGLRITTARPIDPLPVEMIKNLTKLQTHLIELGWIDEYQPVFSPPSLRGGGVISSGRRIEDYPVNLFCDYFQVQTNSKGERYYFRQHQLRRFFAMLFFHSSTFGGLETLQWMLGHTDSEHVWHYITESTSGDVMRGAKAQFVAENLQSGSNDYAELSEFVEKRFNTKEFSVIDQVELEDYINFLLKEQKITVEPEFFTDHLNRKMRIIVKVIEG